MLYVTCHHFATLQKLKMVTWRGHLCFFFCIQERPSLNPPGVETQPPVEKCCLFRNVIPARATHCSTSVRRYWVQSEIFFS